MPPLDLIQPEIIDWNALVPPGTNKVVWPDGSVTTFTRDTNRIFIDLLYVDERGEWHGKEKP